MIFLDRAELKICETVLHHSAGDDLRAGNNCLVLLNAVYLL